MDQVAIPRNDGTRGSALYRIPCQLSRPPSSDWASVFVAKWDRPSSYSSTHRPGIVSVVADKVYLDGTTIEEVEKTHRRNLVLALDETNRAIEEHDRQTFLRKRWPPVERWAKCDRQGTAARSRSHRRCIRVARPGGWRAAPLRGGGFLIDSGINTCCNDASPSSRADFETGREGSSGTYTRCTWPPLIRACRGMPSSYLSQSPPMRSVQSIWIPDFIPVLGYLDDLMIVPLGIWLAVKLVPPELMAECRAAAADGRIRVLGRWGAAIVVALWVLGLLGAALWIRKLV